MGKRKAEAADTENTPVKEEVSVLEDSTENAGTPKGRQPLKTPKELAGDSETWADKCAYLIPIAQPLAPRSLGRNVYKLIRKASRSKGCVRKGVREVQKFIRKGERGVVVLAGNTRPVDVIAHMPVVCEEADIPYCFTPSKQDLGLACGSRRNTCAVLVKANESYKDLYDKCFDECKELPA